MSRREFIRYWIAPAILTVMGAILGYIYHVKVGCVTGTCPIAASPWKMTIYGSFLGFLIGLMFQPNKKRQ